MNLYHLRYFVTLAHLEHYTRAAEELMITQPSLSHAISSLEGELGIQLFEKEGRNIVLTKYGRIFLSSVEQSLAILESGINAMKTIGGGGGKIDIGFLRTLGTNYIPDIVKEFLEGHLNKTIDFHFYTGVTADLIQGLKDKKYDLIFCSNVEKETGIEFIPVASQELVLIVPANHPLAEKTSISLLETLTYPQIFFNKRSGLRAVIDGLFQKIDEKPIIAFEIEEDQVIAGFVDKGFGIAIVPKMPILHFMNVVEIQITNPSWERFFYLATIKNRYLPPLIEEFKQFVISNAKL